MPFKCKKKDVKEFFRPLVPYSLRLPLGKGKKLVGFCYVGFRTEKELKKALAKDKLFIGMYIISEIKVMLLYEEKNVIKYLFSYLINMSKLSDDFLHIN